MSDDILQFIGVSDVKERLQILEFTHDFNTPQKPKKIPCKHALARNGFRWGSTRLFLVSSKLFKS